MSELAKTLYPGGEHHIQSSASLKEVAKIVGNLKKTNLAITEEMLKKGREAIIAEETAYDCFLEYHEWIEGIKFNVESLAQHTFSWIKLNHPLQA